MLGCGEAILDFLELLIQVYVLAIHLVGDWFVFDLSGDLYFGFTGGLSFVLFFSLRSVHINFNVKKISPMER